MASLSWAKTRAAGVGCSATPSASSAASTSAGTCSWSKVTTSHCAGERAHRLEVGVRHRPARDGTTRAADASGASARTLSWTPSSTAGPCIIRASWPPPIDADHREPAGGPPRRVGWVGPGAHGRRAYPGGSDASVRRRLGGADGFGLYHSRRDGLPQAGLMDRLRGVVSIFWREAAKFGVIGAVAFVIDFVGFNLLFYGPLEGRLGRPRRSSPVSRRRCSPGSATGCGPSGTAATGRPTTRRMLFFLVNGVGLVIVDAVPQRHARPAAHGLAPRRQHQHHHRDRPGAPSSGSGPTASSSSPASTPGDPEQEQPRSPLPVGRGGEELAGHAL